MHERRAGRHGLRVSRVGLGTMTWGRDTDAEDAANQLRTFRDAGGTLVDTAASYGGGNAERILGTLTGEGAGRIVSRDELVIASKAGVVRHGPDRRVDVSRRALLDALDATLTRLRTDHVDLWQVHTWSDEVPLTETLAALDAAVATGRARYVGVSNYTGWQTAAAAVWQRAWPGRAPLVSTQVEYSLVARGVEREVLPAAEACGLGVLAWSPLGRGVLTGKYRTGVPADSRAAAPHLAGWVEPYLTGAPRRVAEAVATAADGLGRAPVEVALAWVRDRPGVTSAIEGARTAAQLRGSLTAEDLTLPDPIRRALDDVSDPSDPAGGPSAGPPGDGRVH
jgi:aryl-alcohol dehydrogenase-like predicted oxidoreductase